MDKVFLKRIANFSIRKSFDSRQCIASNGKIRLLMEDNLPIKDPIVIFNLWLNEAKNDKSVMEPNVMCMATSTNDGTPSARFVVCKSFSKDGFKFFTHYTSRKGQELEGNPKAALAFFWASLRKSVRIEGHVDKLPISEAEDFFSRQAYAYQIGALCCDQSKPISSRNELKVKESELRRKYKEGEVPKPEYWGGYVVKPTTIEFWERQTDRIHDRIMFFRPKHGESADNKISFTGMDGWLYCRLAP